MSEDYDEVTRLRLRLSHVEAQRDAFESALRKEVLAVVREEIAKALSPKTIEATWVVSAEDAERIKARLEREKDARPMSEQKYHQALTANRKLLAEVERLRKAGDMCDQLLACFEMEGRKGVNIGRDMWRAAKEGRPNE